MRLRAAHQGRGAAGAEAPARYGPRVAAVIVYLHAGQFLSTERTAVALGELSGIACSSGTVAALTARAAGRLDGFPDQVRQGITASDVAGFDETGFRVEGRLAWVHGARASWTATPANRGRTPIASIACLPRLACTVSRVYLPVRAQCTQARRPSTRNPVSSNPATPPPAICSRTCSGNPSSRPAARAVSAATVPDEHGTPNSPASASAVAPWTRTARHTDRR